ncbi:MAG: Uncharacterised protein [Formosa sp. Hel1_33_131]|nr:MAG: Uncharacterised protein [Formosa sp. Hel1_33_131]
MKVEFQEEQKFTQWYLWVILIGVGMIPTFGIYKQLIVGEEFGDKPMSDIGLVVVSLFTFGLLILFWFIRLKTKIDKNIIQMNFSPFLKKSVKWKEIKTVKIVKYEFMGYGIRLGSEYGTVYNTKGNKGLAIELKTGKKFVIGTQKATELTKIVEKASLQQWL